MTASKIWRISVSFVCLVMLFALIPWGTQEAKGAWPGGTGDVAFIQLTPDSPSHANGALCTVDENGVVDCLDEDLQPHYVTWSSDGEQLAFTAYAYNPDLASYTTDLFVTNRDGSDLRRVTSDTEIDRSPSFSPDGKRLVLARGALGLEDVYVINVDGTGLTRLTTDPNADATPAWSPDGGTIAFATNRDWMDGWSWEIYLMSPDGTNQRPLTRSSSGESNPDWSPDGTMLAFESSGGVVVTNSDGTDQRYLTEGMDPVFSPDGREVAYYVWEGVIENLLEDRDVWAINVTTETKRCIACSPDVAEERPSWQPIPRTFTDIYDSIFADDIEWLAAAGITGGCNAAGTLFCPDNPVTRGQMAAFLVRALGYTDNGGGDLFIDDDNSIFENDIDKLATAGVTRGCDAAQTKFCPNNPVTRGQMAAFLVRALGYSDNGGGDLFIDDDNSIFENDIDRLATAGVTRGCDAAQTKFCPNSSVTRGQMAAFLHRALGS